MVLPVDLEHSFQPSQPEGIQIGKLQRQGVQVGEGRTLHAHMDRFRDGQALDAQIQQTEKQNDVLRSDLDHEGDPDFIQGLARDDLGLASDGERIFYDVNN